MKRLDAVLCPGPAVRAPAETVLVLVPKDERPLRGEAGRIDWRLCGEISALLESGFAFNNPNVDEACGCGESIKFKDA